ncbi:MAG: KpsF/GutQ family sugar-phosphate isomerase, partial [Nannocystaceae bacterium]
MAQRIDDAYLQALELLLEARGRVAVLGMGKSGLIGQNMVSTLASTGTPAVFVHPADLGMIQPGDVAVLISYSGETEEVIQLIPFLRSRDISIVAIVGELKSTLARAADAALDISVEREVCPNNLAPTASTATTLAMANSLAVSLMNARQFSASDFAALHPGGSLGRRLLTRVKDAMRKSPVPV